MYDVTFSVTRITGRFLWRKREDRCYRLTITDPTVPPLAHMADMIGWPKTMWVLTQQAVQHIINGGTVPAEGQGYRLEPTSPEFLDNTDDHSMDQELERLLSSD